MIPYILAAVGGYLIGDSLNAKLFADGGIMAKGGNVRSLFNKFHEEKPSILLLMIADEVSEDFMRKKFDSTIEWDKLSNEEKEKYNSDYRKNKKEFEKYLMYEFVRLYYSDKKVKEKCKGSSKSTISAIKSVMTDLAKKYPENKYADGGMMAKGGKVKWIQDALDGNTKGALRATAKRKGLLRGDENLSKTDLKKLQKMGGKTAKRAHLAETLSKFENGGRIWSEIRADFEDDGYIFVDGWLTENDDEEGKTIAKINIKSGEVIYVDDRAKNDSYAQEVISEARNGER